MLRIVEPQLRIHEVPLENVQLVNSCVTVELDDESENRWRLRFVFATLRLTTMDCAEATAIMAEMDGTYATPTVVIPTLGANGFDSYWRRRIPRSFRKQPQICGSTMVMKEIFTIT